MAESFTVADQGNALRKTLARIAGQIGGPEAISQLWAWSTVENKAVQAEIWRGLRRCGYTTLAADEGPVHARLQQLLELAGWLSSARLAVCQADGEFLLVEALTIEL
jgi:hypothetical protein